MPFASGILALVLLMLVHESGHFFVARAFGMRVERFSIGFGPAIWRHQPHGSDTVYQIAIIPFLAYVQIAGMNPFEEIDPDDKGSYANASLIGRIAAIFAGPLANYLVASVFLFGALMIEGKPGTSTRIEVISEGVAAKAGLKNGDTVLRVDGQAVGAWDDLRARIVKKPEIPVALEVDRGGSKVSLSVTPRKNPKDGSGLIGIRPERIDMPLGEAALASIVTPAKVVVFMTKSFARMLAGKEKPEVSGPLKIIQEAERAAGLGLSDYLQFVGFLSIAVGFFNMLPFPALDGGRLLFLGIEAVTRRRPNQKLEAQVHGFGMLILLTTIAIVTVREWGGDKSEDAKPPSSQAKPPAEAAPGAASAAPPAKAP